MCVCVCVFNLNYSYCAIKKLSTHMLPEIYMYIYIYFFFSVSHTHLKWNTVRHQQWLSQGGRPSVIYFNASFCLSNFLPWELKFLLLKTKKQLKVWEEMYLPQLTFVLAKEDGKTQNTVFIILAEISSLRLLSISDKEKRCMISETFSCEENKTESNIFCPC